MRQGRLQTFALAATIAVAACVDDPIQPPIEEASSSSRIGMSNALEADESTSQLVVFKSNRVPAGFEQRVAALGGRVDYLIESVGAATVSGLDAAGVAALGSDKAVSSIGPEPILEMPNARLDVTSVEAVDAVPASQANPAASFFYPRQWNLRAIGADQAWAAGQLGSPDVTVAILDTGIGYLHPDLAGLVDLGRSVSFTPNDDLYVTLLFPGAHPIADIGFHGTHVAATVSSMGVAAAGVTSRTTLMGVKVCSVATGGCPGGAVFAGIEYAVENGADVINMSLGGAFLKNANPGFVSVINRLFNYAHQNDVIVVVSAGNEASVYTNYSSRKAAEIFENPRASAVFHWPTLERQVRIEGRVEKLSRAESIRYFRTRPLESRISAWASPQSAIVQDRRALERAFTQYREQFAGEDEVPCPPFWGGFRIVSNCIEFWQGRPYRLHDREVYRLKQKAWSVHRLGP